MATKEMQTNPFNGQSEEKNTQLVEREFVKNTPFTIIKFNDSYRIAIGTNIIDEKEFQTKGDCMKYIESKPWGLILTAALCINENYLKQTYQLQKINGLLLEKMKSDISDLPNKSDLPNN